MRPCSNVPSLAVSLAPPQTPPICVLAGGMHISDCPESSFAPSPACTPPAAWPSPEALSVLARCRATACRAVSHRRLNWMRTRTALVSDRLQRKKCGVPRVAWASSSSAPEIGRERRFWLARNFLEWKSSRAGGLRVRTSAMPISSFRLGILMQAPRSEAGRAVRPSLEKERSHANTRTRLG